LFRLLIGETSLDEQVESNDVLGALALEAGFLNVQVAESFGDPFGGFKQNKAFALVLRELVVAAFDFDAAFGVDGGFEADDAVEPPGAIGIEQNSVACEAVFQRVERLIGRWTGCSSVGASAGASDGGSSRKT
jgi:hypothetical protein